MNSEMRRQWIEALTGGAYPQVTGFLRKDINGVAHYDPLGVLCVVAEIPLHKRPGTHYWTSTAGDHGDIHCLTEEQLSFVGLSVVQQAMVIRMNDEQGLSFDELAYILMSVPSFTN